MQQRQSPNPRGYPAGHAAGAAANAAVPNRLPGPSVQMAGGHTGPHVGPHAGAHIGAHAGPHAGPHVAQHGGSLHGMPHAGPHAGPHGGAHGGPHGGPHGETHGGSHGGSHRGSHAGLHAGAHGGSHASLPARGAMPLPGAAAPSLEPGKANGRDATLFMRITPSQVAIGWVASRNSMTLPCHEFKCSRWICRVFCLYLPIFCHRCFFCVVPWWRVPTLPLNTRIMFRSEVRRPLERSMPVLVWGAVRPQMTTTASWTRAGTPWGNRRRRASWRRASPAAAACTAAWPATAGPTRVSRTTPRCSPSRTTTTIRTRTARWPRWSVRSSRSTATTRTSWRRCATRPARAAPRPPPTRTSCVSLSPSAPILNWLGRGRRCSVRSPTVRWTRCRGRPPSGSATWRTSSASWSSRLTGSARRPALTTSGWARPRPTASSGSRARPAPSRRGACRARDKL